MSTPNPAGHRRRMRRGRLALAFVLVASSAVTAQYASADFGDPTTVGQGAVAAGTLELTLADGDATQVFEGALPDFYPAGLYMRTIDITISGTSDLKTLSFTPTDSCGGCATSLLTNDATNGLTIGIERCTVPWANLGTPPARLYLCSDSGGGFFGGTMMLPDLLTPWDTLNDTSVTLSTGLTSFTVGATYYYAIYLRLPDATSAATLDESSTVAYTFTGSQRDAAAK